MEKEKEALLFELIIKTINYSPMDTEERAVFRSIPYLFHDLVSADNEQAFFELIAAHLLKNMERKPRIEHRLLDTLGDFVRMGDISKGLTEDMRIFVNTMPESSSKDSCLQKLKAALEFQSPVIGRWRVESPRTDLLLWRGWKSEKIATALTTLCLPFFRLRPFEFYEESRPGRHLSDLNTRSKKLSDFVALTILGASAQGQKKAGVATITQWLEIAVELEKLRNYHMMFAIQCGLAKHQVDRLFKDLKLKRKTMKMKEHLDEFFDPNTRMAPLMEAMKRTDTPQIACVFCFLQRAILLKETPLLVGNEINLDRAKAAQNVFSQLYEMQKVPYPKLGEDENIVWYFMRLEMGSVEASEEDLYEMSDFVKTLKTSGGMEKEQPLSMAGMSGIIDEIRKH